MHIHIGAAGQDFNLKVIGICTYGAAKGICDHHPFHIGQELEVDGAELQDLHIASILGQDDPVFNIQYGRPHLRRFQNMKRLFLWTW